MQLTQTPELPLRLPLVPCGTQRLNPEHWLEPTEATPRRVVINTCNKVSAKTCPPCILHVHTPHPKTWLPNRAKCIQFWGSFGPINSLAAQGNHSIFFGFTLVACAEPIGQGGQTASRNTHFIPAKLLYGRAIFRRSLSWPFGPHQRPNMPVCPTKLNLELGI